MFNKNKQNLSNILTNLCLTKTNKKNKKYFCNYFLQCFSSRRALVVHKEICSKINSKQTVLASGFTEFKNHSS